MEKHCDAGHFFCGWKGHWMYQSMRDDSLKLEICLYRRPQCVSPHAFMVPRTQDPHGDNWPLNLQPEILESIGCSKVSWRSLNVNHICFLCAVLENTESQGCVWGLCLIVRAIGLAWDIDSCANSNPSRCFFATALQIQFPSSFHRYSGTFTKTVDNMLLIVRRTREFIDPFVSYFGATVKYTEQAGCSWNNCSWETS